MEPRKSSRHSEGEPPSPFVQEWAGGLSAGTALDVACGAGRHALLLSGLGHDVLAVDASPAALARTADAARVRGLAVRTELRDVEQQGLPGGTFDLVVVTRFLARPLFPALATALAPGGVLLYETFTLAQHGRSGLREEYCLAPGELGAAFPGLEVLASREVEEDGAFLASLAARRPRDGSPT